MECKGRNGTGMMYNILGHGHMLLLPFLTTFVSIPGVMLYAQAGMELWKKNNATLVKEYCRMWL